MGEREREGGGGRKKEKEGEEGGTKDGSIRISDPGEVGDGREETQGSITRRSEAGRRSGRGRP